MSDATRPGSTARDPVALAQTRSVLRIAVGVTAALVLAELRGWQPTFLLPVLTAVFIASVPAAPPFKAGIAVVLMMAFAALIAFVLSSFLQPVPQILFGAIGVVVFLGLLLIGTGRGKLPGTLMLLCISTIPVITMIAPAQADLLPTALVRATAVAMIILWCTYAFWPSVPGPKSSPGAEPIASPIRSALTGTAIIMPVMFVYLLFGLADVLPALVATVLLVANLDPAKGAAHATGMMLGNLAGGFLGMIAFFLLQIAPSIATLSIIIFIIAAIFAGFIAKGGPIAAVSLITLISTIIIFSSAIAAGPAASGLWMARLFQFVIACLFAIGMMTLLWETKPGTAAPPTPAPKP